MDRPRLYWPQVLGYGTGGFLLLWGLLGFLATGFSDFTGHADTALLGLRLNPLANAVHVVTGIGFLTAAPKLRPLSGTGLLLAAFYLVLFGIGAAEDPTTNILNVNAASNLLHLFVGFAGLAAAQGAVWRRQCERAAMST